MYPEPEFLIQGMHPNAEFFFWHAPENEIVWKGKKTGAAESNV